jgi:ribosomal protein L30/L7E
VNVEVKKMIEKIKYLGKRASRNVVVLKVTLINGKIKTNNKTNKQTRGIEEHF